MNLSFYSLNSLFLPVLHFCFQIDTKFFLPTPINLLCYMITLFFNVDDLKVFTLAKLYSMNI